MPPTLIYALIAEITSVGAYLMAFHHRHSATPQKASAIFASMSRIASSSRGLAPSYDCHRKPCCRNRVSPRGLPNIINPASEAGIFALLDSAGNGYEEVTGVACLRLSIANGARGKPGKHQWREEHLQLRRQ